MSAFILFIFLTNGNVHTQQFHDFNACHEAQRIIALDHQIRGDISIARMLCLPKASG
jgi:hypothetical protein